MNKYHKKILDCLIDNKIMINTILYNKIISLSNEEIKKLLTLNAYIILSKLRD